ncbi:MAG: hypothetical protein QM740_13830 [Acidovorax sp.]
MTSSHTPQGMLFVASDVDPQHESDFNQWYDQEHVEERARISGFVSGARYRAQAGSAAGARKYLGLYRTQSLAAFTSPAYRAAFERQTPWSVANLERMLDPMRRVCAVRAVAGFGSGSELAVLPLDPAPDVDALAARAQDAGSQLRALPGFVQSYLLAPDATLSTPLPREAREGRVLFPMLVIENSTNRAALLARAAELLAADASRAWLYGLGWKLYASELS